MYSYLYYINSNILELGTKYMSCKVRIFFRFIAWITKGQCITTEIWRMTLKNNRAPLLSIIKLYASFHHHMWIQAGVTVRKQLSWVVTSVTFTFDLWPWPFAWTSLLSLVITPENFMMIPWWEHSQLDSTRRKASEICLRPPLHIYFHKFSR